ncbi:MAG: hypothetical protein GY754_16480 [bacterium]|nr:hypothetical protein [bacterium]
MPVITEDLIKKKDVSTHSTVATLDQKKPVETLDKVYLIPITYIIYNDPNIKSVVPDFTEYVEIMIKEVLEDDQLANWKKRWGKKEKLKGIGVSKKNLGDLPELKDNVYVMSRLRQGYIYLYSENKKLLYEWLILDSGKLEEIDYSDNDERISNGNSNYHIAIDEGDTVYIAFSEDQWSIDFYHEVANAANTQDRESRMQKVIASNCLTNSKPKYIYKKNDSDLCFATNNEKNIMKTRFEWYYNKSELKKKVVYCCLYDPIDLANQICNKIDSRWKEMETCITSIQTSMKTKHRIKSYKKILETESDTGRKKQLDELVKYYEDTLTEEVDDIISLHFIAVYTYRIIFGDYEDNTENNYNKKAKDESTKKMKELAEDVKKYLDEQFLEDLLAVNERKKIRTIISDLRDSLGSLLEWKMYQATCKEYRLNKMKVVHGKHFLLVHLKTLSNKPSHMDYYLDVDKNFHSSRKGKDKWEDLFTNTLINASNEAGKLISHTVKYTNDDLKNLYNKNPWWIKTLSYLCTDTWGLTVSALSNCKPKLINHTKLADKLNFVTVVNKLNKEIKIFELVDTSIVEHPSVKNYLKNAGYTTKNIGKRIHVINNNKVAIPLYLDNKVEIKTLKLKDEFKDLTKSSENFISKFADEIWASKQVSGIIAMANLANLGLSIKNLSAKENIRNYLDLINAFGEATSASLAFLTSFLQSRKIALKEGTALAKLLGFSCMRTLNIVNSAFGAVINTYDMFQSISKLDFDAGVAYGCAAVSGAMLVAGYCLAWNPFTLLIWGIIAFLSCFFAGYFEDTPMEKFYKAMPFAKVSGYLAFDLESSIFYKANKKYPPWMLAYNTATQFGMAYMGRRGHYRKWDSWKDVKEDLYSLLHGFIVELPHWDCKYRNKFADDDVDKKSAIGEILYRFQITVRLRDFVNGYSFLEHKLLLFPKGMDAYENRRDGAMYKEIINGTEKDMERVDGKNGLYTLLIHYKIDDELWHKIDKSNGEIVFCVRAFNKKTEKYFPFDDKYMAYRQTTRDYFDEGLYKYLTDNIFSRTRTMGKFKEIVSHHYWLYNKFDL